LLRADGGSYVPLADIVSVETRTGFSTIRRENGQRVVSVTGDLSEDDPARAEEIMAQLRDQILPNIEAQFGVTTTLSGLAEQERAFLDDALAGFLACMVGIYIVLAWIFASWLRPLVVLCVIPFGLTGAIFGHWHWDVPLSMFTVVGLIGMTGIIINDSIVLVSTVDEYAKDRGLIPAVIDAACDRLRPILLTTLTTVLGLAPLLFETSSQAQFLKPTVITLVYGLGFGMFVVLLLVPAVLAIQADIGKRVRSLRRGLGHRGRIGQAGATLWLASLGVVLWWGLVMGGPILTGGAWGWGAALLPASALTAFLVFSLGVLILVLGLAAGVAYQNRKT
jgi:multidrug efflux pump subunit AcrB